MDQASQHPETQPYSTEAPQLDPHPKDGYLAKLCSNCRVPLKVIHTGTDGTVFRKDLPTRICVLCDTDRVATTYDEAPLG